MDDSLVSLAYEVRAKTLWLLEDVLADSIEPIVCLYARNTHTLMRFEEAFAGEIKQRWG